MQLALVHLLGDDGRPVDPGFGRPGGGGHPSQPIYHPGHPDHGLPAYPSQGLPPYSPGSPDQSLPVPPGVTAPAPTPPQLASKLVVLWRLPNTVEWHGKVIDPSLEAGTPLPPTAAPKS